MGWSLKRAFRNPLSLAFGPIGGGFSGLDPGANGTDTPDPNLEFRDPDQMQWDPITGMPIGMRGPPSHEVALKYQYRAQELTRRRQQALWGDAQNVMMGARNLLQSYRPGGSAALASGVFGQQAGLYASQAQSLEEPDLMAGARQNAEIQAAREAKRARNLQIGLGIVQAGATLGASAIAAGAGGAASFGLNLGNTFAQQGAPPMGTSYGTSGTQMGPGVQSGGPTGFEGSGGSYPYVQTTYQTPQSIQAPVFGSAAEGQLFGPPSPPQYGPLTPGGFGPMPSQGGSESSGGPSAPQPKGGPQTGGGAGPAPGGQTGAGGGTARLSSPGAGGGGLGQDRAFNGPALGGAAMSAAPWIETAVIADIASDPQYHRSTMLRVASARSRLLAAMSA